MFKQRMSELYPEPQAILELLLRLMRAPEDDTQPRRPECVVFVDVKVGRLVVLACSHGCLNRVRLLVCACVSLQLVEQCFNSLMSIGTQGSRRRHRHCRRRFRCHLSPACPFACLQSCQRRRLSVCTCRNPGVAAVRCPWDERACKERVAAYD
jgi:hypothetical protein